jgi:hypothetical protein
MEPAENPENTGGTGFRFFGWIVALLLGVAMLLFGYRNLIPAWQAAAGSGVVGTFTAERRECTRHKTGESCVLYGSWVASDGSSRRDHVLIYDQPKGLRVGGKAKALDTGAQGVFAARFGLTFLMATALTVGGLVIVAMCAVFAFYVVRGSGAKRSPPTE